MRRRQLSTRLAWITLVGMATLIAAACGDDGGVTQPTGTPEPTSTPAPATPPVNAQGTFVLVRDTDLWVAPIDGSSPAVAITSGSLGTQYAGFVRDDSGDLALYYAEQLETASGDDPRADAALYRVALDGSDPEELLRYRARPLSFFWNSASVSPDGAYALVADQEGIMLADLAAGTSRRLLTNSTPCESPANCYSYSRPRWAPNGERALIAKTFWEGGADTLIDPFADVIEEVQTPGGAAIRSEWSPDGASICMSQNTYSSAGAVIVYDVATGDTVDSTLALPLATPTEGALRIDTRGCTWNPDGTLAIAYHAPNEYTEDTIAVLGRSFAVLHESTAVSDLFDLIGWLPDGSGVLFNRFPQQGSEPTRPGVYIPGGDVIDLPVEANAVLAVIP